MTQQEIQKKVRNVLVNSSEIFDCPVQILHGSCEIIPTSFGSREYLTFYFPKKISLEQIDGFKLVNEKGYISIQEKYIKRGSTGSKLELVSYVYRYITSEVNYLCEHRDSNKLSEILSYKFHYDMDLEYEDKELDHPQIHLQVLHNYPRFQTEKEITVLQFLEKVRLICFKNNTGIPIPYTEPIFLMK